VFHGRSMLQVGAKGIEEEEKEEDKLLTGRKCW
jgi:hypothetical protein